MVVNINSCYIWSLVTALFLSKTGGVLMYYFTRKCDTAKNTADKLKYNKRYRRTRNISIFWFCLKLFFICAIIFGFCQLMSDAYQHALATLKV